MTESTKFETEIQCENCGEHFGCSFEDPSESFSATCSNCDAHYPELYV